MAVTTRSFGAERRRLLCERVICRTRGLWSHVGLPHAGAQVLGLPAVTFRAPSWLRADLVSTCWANTANTLYSTVTPPALLLRGGSRSLGGPISRGPDLSGCGWSVLYLWILLAVFLAVFLAALPSS